METKKAIEYQVTSVMLYVGAISNAAVRLRKEEVDAVSMVQYCPLVNAGDRNIILFL